MTTQLIPPPWRLLCVALLCSSCVSAPRISVVNSKTALESQAAGEYHQLENALNQELMSPRAAEIPREQLVEGDEQAALGEVAALYAAEPTDAEWVDKMLIRGCVGEALTGLLQATPTHLTGEVDEAEIARIVGRRNLHRKQIWRYIAKLRSEVPAKRIAASWRAIHLEWVVCNGLVQAASETWEHKKC